MPNKKVKIHEYAKEVNRKSKEIIDFLNKTFKAKLKPASYGKLIEQEWFEELDKEFKQKEEKEKPIRSHTGRKIIAIKKRAKKESKEEIKEEIKEKEEIKKKKEREEKKIVKDKKEKVKKVVKEKEKIKKEETVKKEKIESKEKKDKTVKKEEKKAIEDKEDKVVKEKKIEKEKKEEKVKKKKEKALKPKKKFIKKKKKYEDSYFEEVETIYEEDDTIITSEKLKDITQKLPKRVHKKKKKKVINKEEIAKSVEATIKSIKKEQVSSGKKKYKDKTKNKIIEEDGKKILRMTDYIIVSDLADRIDVDPLDLIQKAIEMGIMVTINQRIDFDNASILAMEYGYEVEKIEDKSEEKQFELEEETREELELMPRPPIVTIMGHVDHGKTTLIDYLRNSRIVDSEYGKITQNIGAYMVQTPEGKITIIDTPGHEAFTAMRARGSQITDIAVIVIAANDSVMPQTREAINHAKLANIPFIIAINKIDLPEADVDRVKRDLLQEDIVVDSYGGKIPCVEISAKTGQGIDELLDTIIVQSQIMELKAPVEGMVKGTVIEVKQDKGLGPVINCLIQKGTLKKNDIFVAGKAYGRIRKMLNEYNKEVMEAKPSYPVLIVGANELPQVGDIIQTVDNIKMAREIARQRYLAYRDQLIKKREITSMDSYERQLKNLQKEDMNIIIKGKVFGVIEALADSLQMLSDDNIKINIIYKEVGSVTENDVNIAIASSAIIIAFDTNTTSDANKYAKKEGIIIKPFNVIYDVIDFINDLKEEKKKPEYIEKQIGKCEIRKVFKSSKEGKIAGLYVTEGSITRNARVRLIREGQEIGVYEIKSLKRNKDDVKKVDAGYECGVVLDVNEIAEGDILEIIIEEKIE